MERITIPVQGMFCEGCVNGIERALSQQNGVESAKASLREAIVVVEFRHEIVGKGALEDAVRHAGFEVGP